MPDDLNMEERPLLSLFLPDEAATKAFGAALAQQLKDGDILALSGDLGAGKSTLARSIIQSLCDVDDVPSPTFTFVQTYEGRQGENIWHFDFYRLDNPEDAYELGIEEAFDGGLCLMEWPEKLGPLIPPQTVWLILEKEEQGRRIALFASKTWEDRVAALKEFGS